MSPDAKDPAPGAALRGITDCHIHVIDPAFPMLTVRSYTPAPVRVPDVRDMMQRCGVERVVIVQISVYGNDNTAMLAAMAELGSCARGVIHLRGDEDPEEIARLQAQGVCGVRINLFSTSESDPAAARQRLAEAAEACVAPGWHIQLFAEPGMVSLLENDLLRLPVPVVLDHFALLSAQNRGSAEEAAVRRLRESGRIWIKLSASYRLEGADDPALVAALARDLAAPSPETVLWGSDWPHPPQHAGKPVADPPERPYRAVATDRLLAQFEDWFPDPDLRRAILVDNPARLYGFN